VYYQQVNFNNNSTPFIYVFRLNGPYDPDQTGSGLQPVGWDNLLVFYNASVCTGSRIEITVVNGSTVPVQFGVAPTVAASSLTSYDQMIYYNRGVKKSYVDGTGRGSSSVRTISAKQNVFEFFEQPYDRDFQAQGNALPGKNAFWTIALQSSDQTTLLTCTMQVKVYYDVLFSDRLPVGLS
jgi:hypothetical protein